MSTDTKKLAQNLKKALNEKGYVVPLGHVYELIAKVNGHRNWDTMKAVDSTDKVFGDPKLLNPDDPSFGDGKSPTGKEDLHWAKFDLACKQKYIQVGEEGEGKKHYDVIVADTVEAKIDLNVFAESPLEARRLAVKFIEEKGTELDWRVVYLNEEQGSTGLRVPLISNVNSHVDDKSEHFENGEDHGDITEEVLSPTTGYKLMMNFVEVDDTINCVKQAIDAERTDRDAPEFFHTLLDFLVNPKDFEQSEDFGEDEEGFRYYYNASKKQVDALLQYQINTANALSVLRDKEKDPEEIERLTDLIDHMAGKVKNNEEFLRTQGWVPTN